MPSSATPVSSAPSASAARPGRTIPDGRPRVSPRAIFAVLAAAAASITLLQSLVTPVLPTIQSDLQTTPGTVTWVITSWLLAAAVATPLLGRVGDMVGKERILLLALAFIAVGSAVSAAAPTVWVLILGRVLQGLGAAVFPLTFGIIRDEFPPERVPSAVGAIAAVIATGSGAGIVLAGPVVSVLSWRWLFWIPAILTTVIGLLAWRVIPKSRVTTPGQINWLAAVLLSGWLVALLVPVTKAHAWGWGSFGVLGLLALAVVLFAAWMMVELRSAQPLIDMRMMRLPVVWTTNAAALLFGAAMFTAFAFLPIFMQTPVSAGYGFGSSVTGAGLLLLPMLVTMGIFGFISGSITKIVSAKAQLVIGAVVLALSCASLVLFHDLEWTVSVAAGGVGIGMGMAYSSMVGLIVQGVPPEQTGVASGMNTNVRTIGGATGTALVSSLISAQTLPNGVPAEAGFTHAFILMTVLATASIGLALLVPTTRGAAARAAQLEAEEFPELAVIPAT